MVAAESIELPGSESTIIYQLSNLAPYLSHESDARMQEPKEILYSKASHTVPNCLWNTPCFAMVQNRVFCGKRWSVTLHDDTLSSKPMFRLRQVEYRCQIWM